ncbi:MAG: Crp/Fnr family transcriptional regulator [Roseitalea sp.]|uniref:Crp/Fnr family transcriptional regulator n=1 Tax=Oceaniradius stylonematis TaxID=2184161 RepID=A0A3A8AH66_9HYPH|nr:Crp/Fnr family transcriptional regulator [Oceaniradius stylonematis]MBO6554267.1 Crp/Fnr family transcriptional regulator [Roseitalea sp.]MBO6953311.1 Crp/Fnr family transcriptional regulator [Rhizobiaceae bacterium]RNC91524.1 MAG: Crp/Fnr family transcriptional regulator [Oricola sp.]MBO6593658.1 Crp/Fnr family transcriptional regulator [Roseitalea sp.]MBO6601054.1 Crp/Fnr family transcriptional regulator [Roseitalea sp.]
MSASPDTSAPSRTRKIACEACPLRESGRFRDFTEQEVSFVSGFKRGELTAEAGSTIFVEGSHSPHLYTVISGWGFRYKTLEDGRRQILNYVLPGDLVGLQGTLLGEMEHSLECLSDMVLCMFERDRLGDLYKSNPALGFDITWLAAREEQILDEHLLSVGQRSALERAAYLLAYLHDRASRVGLFKDAPEISPLTQQHVADTLGLSLVHTNKTLRKLQDRQAIRWKEAGFRISDIARLKDIARWDGLPDGMRPFI